MKKQKTNIIDLNIIVFKYTSYHKTDKSLFKNKY